MHHPLAIFTPQIGTFSETFVRRHVQDLLPGGTVVFTVHMEKPFAGNWTLDCPFLVLREIPRYGAFRQRFHGMARRVGFRVDLENPAHVKRFLRRNGAKVILGEYLDQSVAWLPIAREVGIPFFGHAHGYDVSSSLRDPKWRTSYLQYNDAAGVITVSRASRQRLIELGLDPSKIHVVPCCVDVPDMPIERRERLPVNLVTVGRMVPKKSPILLLDAFRKALQDFPNMRLHFIGDGPLFSAARQFVHTFGLDESVTLHGAVPSDSVKRFLRESDMFLLHSVTDPVTGDEEGLPVSILEAMANALPVVSTRHAGIPEAVVDGETGFLVDEGDSTGMAERIVFLARDIELRAGMGLAGWRRTRTLFCWEREREALLEILGLKDAVPGMRGHR